MHITIPIYGEVGDVFEQGCMDSSVGRGLTVRLPSGPCVGSIVSVEYPEDRSHVIAMVAIPDDVDLGELGGAA